MYIDRAYPCAMQALACYEVEYFRVFHHRRHRKSMKHAQGLLAVRQIPAGELLYYEGMG